MRTEWKRKVPPKRRRIAIGKDFRQHKMTADEKKEEIIKEAKAKKESKLKNRCL